MYRPKETSHLPLRAALGAAVITMLPAPASWAMPMFARKYKMDCSGCHDAPAVPRLNDVGYRFRRAGFRMPEQIGQEETNEFNLGDYFSGKVQGEYRAARDTGGDETSGAGARWESRFEGQEVGLYPVTGSFQRYFATETEISLAPSEAPEIENAYLRGVLGNQNRWLSARVGVFHPIEGYGASDRPLGFSRPFFETLSANQGQDMLIRVADVNRIGSELGAQWRNTSLNVAILNRLNTEIEERELAANGTSPSPYNGKDALVSANQIIGVHGGIGAYWAHGSIDLPVDADAFIAGTNASTWRENYDRVALFVSGGTARVLGLAGAAVGFDHARDPITGDLSTFRSFGAFAESDVSLGSHAAAYLRLDYFDPSTSRDDNELLGVTLGASIYATSVFLIPEVRYRREPPGAGDATSAAVALRVMAIY